MMFLNPSTNSQALEPVLPIRMICIFFPFFAIGRGVNIRLGPGIKFTFDSSFFCMISQLLILTCS